MRRLQRTIGMMALLLLGIGVAAAQAEPQFAGSWVLDRSQSQFPQHEGRGQQPPDAQAQPPHVQVAEPGFAPEVEQAVKRVPLVELANAGAEEAADLAPCGRDDRTGANAARRPRIAISGGHPRKS